MELNAHTHHRLKTAYDVNVHAEKNYPITGFITEKKYFEVIHSCFRAVRDGFKLATDDDFATSSEEEGKIKSDEL